LNKSVIKTSFYLRHGLNSQLLTSIGRPTQNLHPQIQLHLHTEEECLLLIEFYNHTFSYQ